MSNSWFIVNLDTTAPPLSIESLEADPAALPQLRVTFITDSDATYVAGHFQDEEAGVIDLALFADGDLRGELPPGAGGVGVFRLVAVDSVWNATTLAVGVNGASVPSPRIIETYGRTGTMHGPFAGLLARAREGIIRRGRYHSP